MQTVPEVQGHLQILAAAGYPHVYKHATYWENTTPAGHVADTLSTLEELRNVAQGMHSYAVDGVAAHPSRLHFPLRR